jgi:hypothetical protein
VLDDDSSHNGEAEAAAAALGRVVRHEELVTLRRRHSGPVVAHDQAHKTVSRIVHGQHDDHRRFARRTYGRIGPAEGFQSVVHQIDDDLPDLLGVQAHDRQRARKLALDSYGAALQHAGVEIEGVVHEPVEIGRHHAGAAHARKLRELVDQALERLHFRDDGVGAFADERLRLRLRA